MRNQRTTVRCAGDNFQCLSTRHTHPRLCQPAVRVRRLQLENPDQDREWCAHHAVGAIAQAWRTAAERFDADVVRRAPNGDRSMRGHPPTPYLCDPCHKSRFSEGMKADFGLKRVGPASKTSLEKLRLRRATVTDAVREAAAVRKFMHGGRWHTSVMPLEDKCSGSTTGGTCQRSALAFLSGGARTVAMAVDAVLCNATLDRLNESLVEGYRLAKLGGPSGRAGGKTKAKGRNRKKARGGGGGADGNVEYVVDRTRLGRNAAIRALKVNHNDRDKAVAHLLDGDHASARPQCEGKAKHPLLPAVPKSPIELFALPPGMYLFGTNVRELTKERTHWAAYDAFRKVLQVCTTRTRPQQWCASVPRVLARARPRPWAHSPPPCA